MRREVAVQVADGCREVCRSATQAASHRQVVEDASGESLLSNLEVEDGNEEASKCGRQLP